MNIRGREPDNRETRLSVRLLTHDQTLKHFGVCLHLYAPGPRQGIQYDSSKLSETQYTFRNVAQCTASKSLCTTCIMSQFYSNTNPVTQERQRSNMPYKTQIPNAVLQVIDQTH